jgi:DNA-directed RNA polymerase specialized sigma24 family protein
MRMSSRSRTLQANHASAVVRSKAVAVRLEKMREAVKDVPGPARGPVTGADVETLRRAELADLANIAQGYVKSGSNT